MCIKPDCLTAVCVAISIDKCYVVPIATPGKVEPGDFGLQCPHAFQVQATVLPCDTNAVRTSAIHACTILPRRLSLSMKYDAILILPSSRLIFGEHSLHRVDCPTACAPTVAALSCGRCRHSSRIACKAKSRVSLDQRKQ